VLSVGSRIRATNRYRCPRRAVRLEFRAWRVRCWLAVRKRVVANSPCMRSRSEAPACLPLDRGHPS
jgi:hypothetical protein